MPIVVGGTGLYLRWLVHGKPKTPRSTPHLASKAQKKLDKVIAQKPLASIVDAAWCCGAQP